jgi:glycosyltransferase involved in cell wall biosynthesis
MSRHRILLGAFAFSPKRGGEPAVGWNIATRLAKTADVTVILGDLRSDTPMWNEVKSFIETDGLPPGLEVVHVPPDPLIILLEKLHCLPGCWMFYYLAYRRWQRFALQRARQLHAKQPFAICHQLTYIGYREPGDLWKLPVPFVWGPISGAENIPPAFYRNFRLAEMFRPLTRDAGNLLQAALPGRIREAARAAAKVFVVSPAEETLLARWGVKSERMLETGTSQNPNTRLRRRDEEPLRILWSGIFTPRKALPILLRALAQLDPAGQKWELFILGDGPMSGSWMREATNLRLPPERIRWLGRMPHAEAISYMTKGDVLVHTGLREGTPHVVLEALSLGLPVVCHDCGGMATAVDSRCGIKIPLVSFEASIEGFRAAIGRLIDERALLGELSAGAQTRSESLSWDAIVERLSDTYSTLTHDNHGDIAKMKKTA